MLQRIGGDSPKSAALSTELRARISRSNRAVLTSLRERTIRALASYSEGPRAAMAPPRQRRLSYPVAISPPTSPGVHEEHLESDDSSMGAGRSRELAIACVRDIRSHSERQMGERERGGNVERLTTDESLVETCHHCRRLDNPDELGALKCSART